MIDIQTLEVSGFRGAILGMRNPMKSRKMSDSGVFDTDYDGNLVFTIGEKDLELCQKLIASGKDDDSKFLRMIHVQVDINAPLYWWKEMDTYKVATVANSESTMHTIHRRPLNLQDFAHDYILDDYTVDTDWEMEENFIPMEVLCDVIESLNHVRELYFKALEAKDHEKIHTYWYNLIQMLPSSYMQKRTWDADYQTIRRIYFARKGHKLEEWHKFREWVESLPYAEELIMYKPTKPNTFDAIANFDPLYYAVNDTTSPLYFVDKEHGFNKSAEMARISNLITNMVLEDADKEELVRAIKHSCVVIDAQKFHLDWKKSEKDNNIIGLELKYGKK